MMNRINTFLFLAVLTATISVIPIASAEAHRISWQGMTSNLSDPDSAEGLLTIEGVLVANPDELTITAVRLERLASAAIVEDAGGLTLRCRNSHVEITQEFPEEEYVVEGLLKEKANLFVVQFLGVDGKTAISGTIKLPDYTLRATVTVAQSRVFFTGPNDANANVELCTARLAVKADGVAID